ncbi:TonB-dependent receptor [Sandaracinobacter sp. RS1-74]|uniref:TonB-dependent receptor domain-containing protein n=1 Tax=Sandaracinobacteroides sayramensis TaxID=2913411 RepID=UPI001EDC8FB5|nr:TonB-dependent receptor [Sandaracinobacteroides sayramensis]MCG2840452.1 TonB-dependent receptor [Sandaracinobacteroides sayramensis]
MKLSNWLLLMGTTALACIVSPAAWAQQASPADEAGQDRGDQNVDVSTPGAGGLSGDDIVVIGRSIPNVIKATPSVLSVLSQADIDRAGDGDIAGALARVTGLSVVGGKYVYVRGLGERYSLALLNGLPIPSPEPLKRVVPLDIFPTDLLSSTAVQKSYSVNYPGEFGGGVINLTTRAVPEESFLNVSGSIGGDTITTGQMGYTYWGSQSDWTGFDGGARSAPAPLRAAMNSGKLIAPGGNFSVDEMKTITASLRNAETNLIQRNDTIPANMSLGFTGGTAWDVGEDRLGVIFSANWSNSWQTREGDRQSAQQISEDRLSPDQVFRFVSTENRILVNGLLGVGYEFGEHQVRFTNVYIRDVLKQARIEAGDDYRNSTNNINRGVTNWLERQLFSSSLVSEFKFGDFSLDLRGTYAKSQRNSPYERTNTYVYSSEVGDYVNNLRSGGTGSSIAFSNLNDTVWAGTAGVGYSLPTARPVVVSAGYAYSNNERDSTRRQFAYLPQASLPLAVTQQRPDFLLSDFNIYAYDITLSEQTGGAGVASYEAGLRTHAGYGQVEAELADGLKVNAGVRYESGRQFLQIVDLFGNAGDPAALRTSRSESYWLPAATVTWNFAENQQFRFAASKTIARPQFRELAPQQYIDTDNDRTSIGNRYLVDSELLNLEARYEWYFNTDERLLVGGFFKKIDKPIEVIAYTTGNSIFTSFANAPEAQLYGAEVEVQKFLSLGDSGFFSDRRLLVSANYTYTQSKLKVKAGDTTVSPGSGGVPSEATLFFSDGDSLTGQSDHVANLQLGLQREGKLSEQTLLVNFASDRVSQRGPGVTPDYIERPGVQLDFVLREEVDLGRQPIELKFEVRNILGTNYRESQTLGDDRVLINAYDVGTSFSLGITAKF